jgi:hypothetical protein
MEFTTLAEGLDHPEGATVGPDGTVYAGGEAGQIYRIAPDGTPEAYADTGGFLYGVTVDGGGNVYGCDMGRGEIVRVDPTGAVTTYSRGTEEHPLRVPNFAAFDDAGVLYVTESGDWGADDGPGLPGRARRRDDGVERRGHGVPQRVLPDRGRRRAARGRVAHAARRPRADRGRRRGRGAGAGRRPHWQPAGWDRARHGRHDLRRLLPARPRVAHRAERQARGVVRGSRRRGP